MSTESDVTTHALQRNEKLPYTRVSPLFCPNGCGAMSIVTRASEKASHDAPIVWSCFPCQTSWASSVVRVDVVGVEFDDGKR